MTMNTHMTMMVVLQQNRIMYMNVIMNITVVMSIPMIMNTRMVMMLLPKNIIQSIQLDITMTKSTKMEKDVLVLAPSQQMDSIQNQFTSPLSENKWLMYTMPMVN